MNYEQKYLKYKNKYLTLKKQIGGWKCLRCNTVNEESLTVCKSCAKKHSVGAPSGAAPTVSGSSVVEAAPSVSTAIECAVCRKPAKNRCGKCNMAYYCDASCQRADWPTHKVECNRLEQERDRGVRMGARIIDRISGNKTKFLYILGTVYAKYKYIKYGGIDPEIIQQFNQVIEDSKNDVLSSVSLIKHVMTKNDDIPETIDERRQMNRFIREFDEGRRTCNDPIEFTF